jgi:hypothetical protein
MYEAPDRYKRMVSARLPAANRSRLTAASGSDSGSPLRDVQLISRAQLAPFFAGANSSPRLLAAALWKHVAPQWLLGWLAPVALTNFGAMHWRAHRRSPMSAARAAPCPNWLLVGDVVVRALLWLSLPLYLFPTLDPGSQMITAR